MDVLLLAPGARLVVGDGDALLDGEADAVAVKDAETATLVDATDETVADADLVPVEPIEADVDKDTLPLGETDGVLGGDIAKEREVLTEDVCAMK